MLYVSSTKGKKQCAKDFFKNIGMRCLSWKPEIAHVEPLEGPLSVDQKTPFLIYSKFMVGRTSTLTMLSFV